MPTISTNGYSQADSDLVDMIVQSMDPARQGSADPQTQSLSTIVNARMLDEIAENKNGTISYRKSTRKEKKELIASIYAFGVREIILASDLCYEQTKWEDWSLYCRTCCVEVVAVVSHPDLNRIWSDVVQCAIQASVGITVAAVLASPPAATLLFKPIFYACLLTKGHSWANAISVDLKPRESCGNWRYCL